MVKSRTLIRISVIFLVVLSARGANEENKSDGLLKETESRKVSTDDIESELAKPSYGILEANETKSGVNAVEDYCMIHYNGKNIPSTRESSTFHSFENLTTSHSSTMLCTPLPPSSKSSIVLISYDTSRCNISQQLSVIMTSFPNVSGIVIQIPPSVQVRYVQIDVKFSKTSMLVALMREKSVKQIFKRIGNGTLGNVEVKFFSPQEQAHMNSYPFDYSLVVIWILAVFTVVVGSFWSGTSRASLYFRRRYERTADDGESPEDAAKPAIEEEPYLNISPMYILFFVCCMGGMLVALYFFFKYLVYLIIGLFVMASMLSVYACIEPLMANILPSSCTSAAVPVCSKKHPTPIYQLAVFVAALALALTWFFTRKESYSWVLQDILGIFFSINMLRTVRLPSFKICFILLNLLFIYDIFFVFITPYFTSSGDSVMVQVATGGSKDDDSSAMDSGTGEAIPRETLPMVLRVPHLSIVGFNATDPLEVCFRDMRSFSYSLLGFGDILVPGLLVSYCHAFDIIHDVRGRLYFVTTSICYGLGLIITFFGLYFMNGIAQPALLYLVPCTVIPPLVIAYFRDEVRKLWDGPGDGSEAGSDENAPDKASSSRRDSALLDEEERNGTNNRVD
ncbi:Signal peptide peptidase-like 2B [Halotydeus destructor]|nr:Signal peptide peptidase-like 2B [Halotydeus destructor]